MPVSIDDAMSRACKEDEPTQNPNIPATEAPEIQNPLSKAREQMKRSAKLHVATGIVEGLNEILIGDFSGIEEELAIAVDDFTERVAHPKSSDLALKPSSSSFFQLTEGA
jgi:hypothetical protein